MSPLLLVCLGGALGSGLRYLVVVAALRALGPEFPFGTLAVNLTGSFLIGVVQQAGLEARVVPDSARLFLSAGVLGGFTTYSAFSYETVRLAQAGAWPQAGLNAVVTTIGCLAACTLGILAGRLLLGARG